MEGSVKNQNFIRPSLWQSVFHPLPASRREVNSICCLCNGGCGLIVKLTSQGKILGVSGDPANPMNQGAICPKPMSAAQSLYHHQRVSVPLIRVKGKLTPASWDDAINLTASRYSDYLAKYDNASVVGIMSKAGGSYSKLALAIFEGLTGLVTYGTGPVCTMSEEAARTALLGNPSTPNPLWDVVNAKILLIVGNNVAQTKAGQFHWIMKARRQGTKVVAVDTRFTETAQQADLYLPIRPGTDGALALALIREVIVNQTYDQDFVQKHTAGFAELFKAAQRFTPEYTEEITGIPARLTRSLAEDLGRLKPGMFYGGRGIMCTNNAAGAVLGFEALMCILGNLGKPGGGIVSHITGYGKPARLVPPDIAVKPVKRRKAAELYPAMETGEIKMMLIAGNPAVTWPDSARMSRALAGLNFVVSHTLFLDDTAELATVVLPATHWLEEAGMQASVNRVLQWRDQAVAPYGEAKSGGDVFRLLAEKMGLAASLFPNSPEEAWEMERKLTPSISAISWELAKETAGGVSYPYPINGQPEIRLYQDGQVKTPSGKAQLHMAMENLSDCYPYFHPPLQGAGNDEGIAEEYPLMLNTAKVAWHYHTQSQYSLWNEDLPGPHLEMHPDLAKEIGVQEGELVTVETRTGSVTLPARITKAISKDSVCTQYCFGQKSPFQQQPVNSLFPPVYDPVGGNFVQKNLQCRISKAKGGPACAIVRDAG